MDDAAGVGGGQSVGDLYGDGAREAQIERLAAHQLPHVLPLDVLHDGEIDALQRMQVMFDVLRLAQLAGPASGRQLPSGMRGTTFRITLPTSDPRARLQAAAL